MTEIEQLIEQAVKVKVRLKSQPKVETPIPSSLSWQELLDGKPYPHLRYGKL